MSGSFAPTSSVVMSSSPDGASQPMASDPEQTAMATRIHDELLFMTILNSPKGPDIRLNSDSYSSLQDKREGDAQSATRYFVEIASLDSSSATQRSFCSTPRRAA